MSVEHLLRLARDAHIILDYTGMPFLLNTGVTQEMMLSLAFNNAAIRDKMRQGHHLTCTNPQWHNRLGRHYHAGNQVYKCSICEAFGGMVA